MTRLFLVLLFCCALQFTTNAQARFNVEGEARIIGSYLELVKPSNTGHILNMSSEGAAMDINATTDLYLNANDNINLHANNSNGEVGIGTSNPTSILHIVGTKPTLKVLDPNLGIGEKSSFRIGKAQNDNQSLGIEFKYLIPQSAVSFHMWGDVFGDALTIQKGGNVGIGTDAPEKSLHVSSGSAGNVEADLNSIAVFEKDGIGFLQMLTPEANPRGILFGEPGANRAGGIIYNGTNASDGLDFRTNGNNSKMVITSTGNVGIGTTSATSKLQVDNTTNSTPYSILLNSNNGLIRTNSWAQIHLQNKNGSTTNFWHIGHRDNNNFDIAYGPESGTVIGPSNAKLTILPDGKVGIGVTTPDELLHVNGKIKIGDDGTLEDLGSLVMGINAWLRPTIDNSRDLGSSIQRWDDVYATNGVINTSDRKDKTNIRDLEYGLEEVLQLKPVRYQWKNNKSHPEKLGLIAQDLLDVIPEVVKTHDWLPVEGSSRNQLEHVKLERLGVYYSDIIPVLVHAIQEQQTIIEELRSTNEIQQTEIDDLKTRLAQIEALLQGQSTNQQLPTSTIQLTTARLEQNQPNPFTESTLIRYFIPEGIKKAELRITNVAGKVLKEITIPDRGAGQTKLEAQSLSAGTYFYTLTLDSRMLETKSMVLTKN